jgi:catechol 2,3-dioxygenase-like lactoylglutathione lyase family enzyme
VSPPHIVGIDHVQLAMPPGPEAEERAIGFFQGLLGLPRVPKPPELALRGGCWFELGPARVHLGVEEDFRPARKAHPALVVDDLPALCRLLDGSGHPALVVEDLDSLAEHLAAAGLAVRPDTDLPGVRRCYVDDPFGNRIELGPARPEAVPGD